MKNELTIMKKLQEVIQTQLNSYLPSTLPTISTGNVEIDFPDIDKMPKNVMFYLQPNYADYEPLSTESDSSLFNVSVFIICKKDKQENLTEKVYGYFNALYALLRNNIGLDNTVDFVDVNNADFYPAVEGNANVKATEVGCSVRYTKDF